MQERLAAAEEQNKALAASKDREVREAGKLQRRLQQQLAAGRKASKDAAAAAEKVRPCIQQPLRLNSCSVCRSCREPRVL